MAARIAVVDPLPMFQYGVATVLASAGLTVDTPDDPVTWGRQVHDGVVLLTLRSERDWQVLAALRLENSRRRVIALIEDAMTSAGVRAIRAGASSVLDRGVHGETLRRTVEATMGGQAVVPATVLAVLAGSAAEYSVPPRSITPAKIAWLRGLASGLTVAQLAEQAGYSERAMFRLLGSLYKELGVAGRMEALMYAMERGWLRDDAP